MKVRGAKPYYTRLACLQDWYYGAVFYRVGLYEMCSSKTATKGDEIHFDIGHLSFRHIHDPASNNIAIVRSGQEGSEEVLPFHCVLEAAPNRRRATITFAEYLLRVSKVLHDILAVNWYDFKIQVDNGTECEAAIYRAWIAGQDIYDGTRIAMSFESTAYDLIFRVDEIEEDANESVTD